MYTDGETFYYRSDLPNRSPNRSPNRTVNRTPDRSRPVSAPADDLPRRLDDVALAERLSRLESQSEQLQRSLAELSVAIQRLVSGRDMPSPAPTAARGRGEGSARGEEPARAEVPAQPERLRAPAARESNESGEGGIKASVFAGGAATAVLGAVRFELDEE